MRAYENVCRRLAQTVTVRAVRRRRWPIRWTAMPSSFPELATEQDRRFPDEPFRRRFTYMAERLRRTRTAEPGGYRELRELSAEMREIREALDEVGLVRVAEGDLRDFEWQIDTFRFHGLSLEIRQHSAVHAATLAAASDESEVSAGVTAGEVLETFRTVADLQTRYGEAACHRYVISFTHSAEDVIAVLDLAQQSGGAAPPTLDVVPLFESADALASAGAIVDALLQMPRYQRHLATRGHARR